MLKGIEIVEIARGKKVRGRDMTKVTVTDEGRPRVFYVKAKMTDDDIRELFSDEPIPEEKPKPKRKRKSRKKKATSDPDTRTSETESVVV